MPSWIAFDLAVGVARADDEEVGVAEHAAQVELDDVDRLLVGGEAGDRARRIAAPAQLASAVIAYEPVQPVRRDVAATASGTR